MSSQHVGIRADPEKLSPTNQKRNAVGEVETLRCQSTPQMLPVRYYSPQDKRGHGVGPAWRFLQRFSDARIGQFVSIKSHDGEGLTQTFIIPCILRGNIDAYFAVA